MKKLWLVLFAALLMTSGVMLAQDSMGKAAGGDSMSAPKLMSVVGKISADGKTFTADQDGKAWSIKNPEAVKGHEGHHVELSAHVYADKGEVHVMSLKMAAMK